MIQEMRARTAGVEQMSIEDVVIIDIDNTSVGPIEEGGLGRYHNQAPCVSWRADQYRLIWEPKSPFV